MTTSQTTNLHLTKAVKGTNEPFSIDAINANLDTIDTKIGAVGSTDLQSQVTALGESVSRKIIGTITNGDIQATFYQSTIFKISSVASITIRLSYDQYSDGMHIATVSDGFKPDAIRYMVGATSEGASVPFYIETDGKVKTGASGTGSLYLCSMYLI